MFALAPGKGIFAHREPGGVLHAYIALSAPKEWFAAIDFADAAAAKARVAAEFDGLGARAERAHHRRRQRRPCRARSTRCRPTTAGSARPASRCWATPRI